MMFFASITTLCFAFISSNAAYSGVDKIEIGHDNIPIRDLISNILTRLDEKDKQILELQAANREKALQIEQLNVQVAAQERLTAYLQEQLQRVYTTSVDKLALSKNGSREQELYKANRSNAQHDSEGRLKYPKIKKDADIQSDGIDSFTSPTTPVAFFATVDKDIFHSGVNQIIKFDNVVTNIGNAFVTTLGAFICSRPGVYMFMTTLLSQRGQGAHYQLRKNKEPISWIYGNGNEATQTVVVVMDTGDTITLTNTDVDETIIGGNYTTFGGYLLFESLPHSTMTIVG